MVFYQEVQNAYFIPTASIQTIKLAWTQPNTGHRKTRTVKRTNESSVVSKIRIHTLYREAQTINLVHSLPLLFLVKKLGRSIAGSGAPQCSVIALAISHNAPVKCAQHGCFSTAKRTRRMLSMAASAQPNAPSSGLSILHHTPNLCCSSKLQAWEFKTLKETTKLRARTPSDPLLPPAPLGGTGRAFSAGGKRNESPSTLPCYIGRHMH